MNLTQDGAPQSVARSSTLRAATCAMRTYCIPSASSRDSCDAVIRDRFSRVMLSTTQKATMQYMSDRKIRVLVAKPGLDGHDRGAKVIARALRDAGMEVIYTGLRQTPEMIAAAALQEDVDAVGVSILSGAHNTLCPRIVQLLHDQGMDDCLVLLGGIVPQDDIAKLKANGVAEVFLPGTSTENIVKFLRENVKPRE